MKHQKQTKEIGVEWERTQEKEDVCWGKHENFKHDCMRGNNSE